VIERRRVRAIYDRRAPAYDRTVGAGERLLVGDLRERFGALLRGRTLEIAAGTGLNLPHYAPNVTETVAVDLSMGMLREARGRAGALGRPVGLAQMDAEVLAFPDGAFETVAVSLALCTVGRPEVALREMARVCAPGGRVVLLEHVLSPVWPVAVLQRLLSPLQTRAMGCHLDRETVALLRREGLRSNRRSGGGSGSSAWWSPGRRGRDRGRLWGS
jgi:ubiquinone/menaquinone biosynthesis C-methylase UbiE